jgi:hypothetical protein
MNRPLDPEKARLQYLYGCRLGEAISLRGRAQLIYARSFSRPKMSSVNVCFGKSLVWMPKQSVQAITIEMFELHLSSIPMPRCSWVCGTRSTQTSTSNQSTVFIIRSGCKHIQLVQRNSPEVPSSKAFFNDPEVAQPAITTEPSVGGLSLADDSIHSAVCAFTIQQDGVFHITCPNSTCITSAARESVPKSGKTRRY